MIVLDSTFVIAYHNERDLHHAAATQVMGPLLDGARGESLLPEYVFLEVVTLLAARLGLDAAVDAGETLLNARDVEFVPCSEPALETFDVCEGNTAAAGSGCLGLRLVVDDHGMPSGGAARLRPGR